MAQDAAIRDIEIIDDRLYVGTEGSGEYGKFGYVELSDPSVHRVFPTSSKTVKLFRQQDGVVYFNAGGAAAFSIADDALIEFPTSDTDLGELWGLDYHDGSIVVVSGGGFVAEIDPTTGAVVKTDLIEAGAPADPQLGMSVSVGGGYAYVGGNGSMARHSLSDGNVVALNFPGEAKDGVVVGGVLYTGQYSSEGIWRYDPRTGADAEQAIALPQDQNRPQDVFWDDVNRLVLAGVQCDTKGGGAFAAYSPERDEVGVHINPFDEYQMVRTVTSSEGIAYLGGENPYATGPRGEIAAWDPVRGVQLWRIDPGQAQGVSNLVVRGRHLYCICRKGEFLIVDIPTRAVIHRANLSAMVPNHATLVVSCGTVYGVSEKALFAFDRKTFAVSTVVADLNGEWYGMPRLAVDTDGSMYTLRQRNLVRVVDKR